MLQHDYNLIVRTGKRRWRNLTWESCALLANYLIYKSCKYGGQWRMQMIFRFRCTDVLDTFFSHTGAVFREKCSHMMYEYLMFHIAKQIIGTNREWVRILTDMHAILVLLKINKNREIKGEVDEGICADKIQIQPRNLHLRFTLTLKFKFNHFVFHSMK